MHEYVLTSGFARGWVAVLRLLIQSFEDILSYQVLP